MANILKIKNTIAFLQESNPEALNELKKQFPGNTEILEGKEKYGAEYHADTPEKKNAVLAVTVKALEGLVIQFTPLQNLLREKLSRAQNLRFIASLIAVFSSTVLAALISTQNGSLIVKVTIAGINLFASALPLIANWMETSKYGGSKKLVDYLTEINTDLAEAKNIERLLQKDVDLNNYDDDTIKNIKKTDEIFGKLADIQEQLN